MSDIIDRIPPFLREILQKEYPSDAERILEGYGKKRPVTLRANTLKTSAEETEAALKEAGFSLERVPWYRDAFVLYGAEEQDVERTALFPEGKIYLQSLSSMLPPLCLSPAAGENILDMTAAPGGKTTQLAALSGGKALITACEKDKIRFERLKFNLARQGAVRVNAMLLDAGKLDEFLRFDKILLDAPCSGSGTLGLSVPVKISPALIGNSVSAQERILKKALRLLKKGGTLVYSTCSVLKEENEEVVFRALKGSGAELVPLSPEGLPLLPGAEGTVTVCPDGLFEGFFLAKLVKR